MLPSRRIVTGLAAALALVVVAGCADDADTTAPDGGREAGVLRFQPVEPGPATSAALEGRDVDVAVLLSTEGAIAEHDWVVLGDDRRLQPAENLVPVARNGILDRAGEDALDALSAEIATALLTELNRRVDGDLEAPEDVARDHVEQLGVLDDVQEGSGSGPVTIGAASFGEQEVVAHLYGIVLAHAGHHVTVRTGLGDREVVFAALEAGEIDLAPEYLGSLLEHLEEGTATSDADESLAALRARLAGRDLTALEPSPAEHTNALVVRRATAERYDLTVISDLLGVTDVLVLGAPRDCVDAPLCLVGLREVYGLRFQGVP